MIYINKRRPKPMDEIDMFCALLKAWIKEEGNFFVDGDDFAQPDAIDKKELLKKIVSLKRKVRD